LRVKRTNKNSRKAGKEDTKTIKGNRKKDERINDN
jgi:hypothetical protein